MSVFSLPLFTDSLLWQQAMTHRSFVNEQTAAAEHNERLEFLGDAILTFVSAAYLYSCYPQRSEGELTAIRSVLVDKPQLCNFARRLGLGEHMRLGKGTDQEGGRESARLLCSVFEAMIGAYFLDRGGDVRAVSDYVLPMFETVVEQAVRQSINAKSQLQEWTQKHLGKTPEYRVVRSSGPDHAKQFEVEVRIGGKAYGKGNHSSKKEAEKVAAQAALSKLTVDRI